MASRSKKPSSEKSGGDDKPIRVAIVGGGCAGIAAAWQLSRNRRFVVDVYEKSWRLGGKGASGRAANGNIHEHGLHLWMGFYENAFRMMRECYSVVQERDWGPSSHDPNGRLSHRSVEEAFFPEPHIGVANVDPGDLKIWSGFLPPAKGLPGEPLDDETNPFTLANYLLRCLELLKALMLSVIGSPAEDVPGKPRPNARSSLDEVLDLDFSSKPGQSPQLLIERMAGLLRNGVLTGAAALLQAVTIIENWLHEFSLVPQAPDSILNLLEALASQVRKQLRDFVSIDEKLRWKTEIIDLVMAIAVGLYKDRVLFSKNGLDAINDMDYREWLHQHGATRTSLQSRFLSGIYDLVFAYADGDRARPSLAAGVALRGALRMFFTYRGSMFWRMRSGMGDAVFAPLYKVLSLADRQLPSRGRKKITARPVGFHFCHELDQVGFEYGEDGHFVTSLVFKTVGDPDGLDQRSKNALDHFGCWPDDDQGMVSKERESGKRSLRIGEHFDAVIFAMGVEDFVEVCSRGDGHGEFFEKMPREWKEMRENIKTVATKSAQVWLSKDLEQLGWHRGSGLFTALGPPFDTWADMTHTLATERAWRAAMESSSDKADPARSVAYFCAVMGQSELDPKAGNPREKVEKDLDSLMDGYLRRLWPAVSDEIESKGGTVRSLQTARFVSANVTGSERYTLSDPGSIKYRISPLDRSVLNMTIAGDWTACGLDAGCVESAVMSGMLAAHAISDGEDPALESIVGFDHP